MAEQALQQKNACTHAPERNRCCSEFKFLCAGDRESGADAEGRQNVLGYYRNLGSLRYGNEYSVEKSTLSMGIIFFSSSTEAYFNHAVITAHDWFV